jgi:hypothetical protein
MSFTLAYILVAVGVPALTFGLCVLGNKLGSH